jgi:hypothetical protein
MRRRRESEQCPALVKCAPKAACERGLKRPPAIGQGVETFEHDIEAPSVAREADRLVAGEGEGSRQRQSPLLQRRGV